MSSHRSRSRSPGRNDHHQDYSPPQNDENHKNHSGDRDSLPPRGGGGDGDGCKLYVGNLDFSSDEHRLREVFSEFGAVTDVYLPRDRYSSRPRGFGFVTLESRVAAERAISQMDQSQLDGRRIIVNESKPQGQGLGSQFNKHGDKDVKLYVGNLSSDTSEETLKDFFSRVGPVLDCYFPTDRDTNQPRGFGFITMSSEDAEKACHQLDGEEVDGRNIRVNEARPKGPGGSRGGGYNDGSGYGGGRGGYGGSRGGYGGGNRVSYNRDGYGGGYENRGGYDEGRGGSGYENRGGYDGGRSGGGYDNRRGGGRYDDRGGSDEGRGGGGYDNRGGYEGYGGRV